jgi:hypothetical protein
LSAGQRIPAADGSTLRVASVTPRTELGPVYNIEVDGDHCYQFGGQGLRVHNASAVANPNLIVIQASSSVLEAVDCANNQFFIKATLTGGLLKRPRRPKMMPPRNWLAAW